MKNSSTCLQLFFKKVWRVLYRLTPFYKKEVEHHSKTAKEKQKNIDSIVDKLFPKGEERILDGPFQDLLYFRKTKGSQLLPKLVGSYEEPIHVWIDEIICSQKYKTIINVGCAEGYYACGFGFKIPSINVYAFDIDISAIESAKDLARINNLKNIHFYTNFTSEFLQEALIKVDSNEVLLFMDVEGDEKNLLNPDITQGIDKVDILVELHDCYKLGLTEMIIDFLANTHKIEIICDYLGRSKLYNIENKELLSNDEIELIMDESRPSKMRWMFARTR